MTRTNVLDLPIRIEPSVMHFPISVGESFANVLCVHTDVGEDPISLL